VHEITQPVNASGKVKVLVLSARTTTCLSTGDYTNVTINYHSADDHKTNALAFKTVFDSSFYTLDEQLSSVATNENCLLSDAEATDGSYAYACASLRQQLVVPQSVPEIMTLVLRATGKQGVASISIVPTIPSIEDSLGYTYAVSEPLELSMGDCTHAPTTAPPTTATPTATATTTAAPMSALRTFATAGTHVEVGTDPAIADDSATQVVYAIAQSMTCLVKGDTTNLEVNYYAANNNPTTALSFAVTYDPVLFDVAAPHALFYPDCQLSGLVHHAGVLVYTCASMTGHAAIPASVDAVVSATLTATGRLGDSEIHIQANANVKGRGYVYAPSPVLAFHHGICAEGAAVPPTPTPAPPVAHAADREFIPPYGFELGNARVIGTTENDGDTYVVFDGNWMAPTAGVPVSQLRDQLCTVSQRDIIDKCGRQKCDAPNECATFTCPSAEQGCHFAPPTTTSATRRLQESSSVNAAEEEQWRTAHPHASYAVPTPHGSHFGLLPYNDLTDSSKDVSAHLYGYGTADTFAVDSDVSFITLLGEPAGASPSDATPGLPRNFGTGHPGNSIDGRSLESVTRFRQFGSRLASGEFGIGAPINHAPNALVYGKDEQGGDIYLTHDGNLDGNMLSSHPSFIDTPEDRCVVTQSMIDTQCGNERCTQPDKCASIQCPVLPEHCQWVTASDASDPYLGALSGVGMSGLTLYDNATVGQGRTYLSHGGRLQLGDSTDDQLAVCIVSEKDIESTCGVQQCRTFVTKREPAAAPENSFVVTPVDCGLVSMQSCKRATVLVDGAECPTNHCEPCALSDWSTWSSCSQECGGGDRSRVREVTSRRMCDSDVLEDHDQCNTQPCPGDCVYSDWSSWETCSATCGVHGTQMRQRSATVYVNVTGQTCPLTSETQRCNIVPCSTTWHLPYVQEDDGTLIDSSSFETCSHTSCEIKCESPLGVSATHRRCRTHVYDWHQMEANGRRHHCIGQTEEQTCDCVCSNTFTSSRMIHITPAEDGSEQLHRYDISGDNPHDNTPPNGKDLGLGFRSSAIDKKGVGLKVAPH
jgi:hypothetical protein